MSITGGAMQLTDNITANTPLATSNVNLTSLSITGNGVLDIGNNRIIIDYTSPDTIRSPPSPAGSPTALPSRCRRIGPSIISSDIAADDAASGFSYASVTPTAPMARSPACHPVRSKSCSPCWVTPTWTERSTPKISRHSRTIWVSNGGWDQGDFNYDGTVNSEDFTPFSSNLNESASLAATAAAGSLEADGRHQSRQCARTWFDRIACRRYDGSAAHRRRQNR